MPRMSPDEADRPGSEGAQMDQGELPEASQEPAATPSDRSDVIQIRSSHFFAVLLPIAFALGLGLGYLLWGQASAGRSSGTAAGSSDAVGRVEITPGDDPSIGPHDAPITIIEFSDFNCRYCQYWHGETFQQLLDTYPDQIRFVYKDFPVAGGGAVGMDAAQAANCAGEQGMYWEYHDALFSGLQSLNRTGFQAYAEGVGLDAEALLACLDSGRYEQEVTEDLQYGAGLGITGTPTFFINGIPLVGAQPLLRFIEIINSELGQ